VLYYVVSVPPFIEVSLHVPWLHLIRSYFLMVAIIHICNVKKQTFKNIKKKTFKM